MRPTRRACAGVLWCGFVLYGLSVVAGQPAPSPAPRPIGILDIMAWKTISTSVVSNDG